eukprot:3757245-Prorocentrum_lima.AAC.1
MPDVTGSRLIHISQGLLQSPLGLLMPINVGQMMLVEELSEVFLLHSCMPDSCQAPARSCGPSMTR